eukprot:TRINITY_DN11437_c0_g1_i6.p1 TRINITY_DN11437_c0_g1~~TRINITY_DN11437_c0_g1_i6.p1  ORF type:complete len:270 (+),score=12.27 TRINITY_DN11437_c0_g1_i6:512-1321(+)
MTAYSKTNQSVYWCFQTLQQEPLVAAIVKLEWLSQPPCLVGDLTVMGTDEPCAWPDPRWSVVDRISESEVYEDNRILSVTPTDRNYTIYAYKELSWSCEHDLSRFDILVASQAQAWTMKMTEHLFGVCFLLFSLYCFKYIAFIYYVTRVDGLLDLASYFVLLSLLALQICITPFILFIQSTSKQLLNTTCSDPITNRILHNSASTFLSRSDLSVLNLIVLCLLTRSALHEVYACWRAPTTIRDVKSSLCGASLEPVKLTSASVKIRRGL